MLLKQNATKIRPSTNCWKLVKIMGKFTFFVFLASISGGLGCARAEKFSRAHQYDVEVKFCQLFLLLQQNATTPLNFIYQKICCFLLSQQKNVVKKFSNNIEKILVWQFFSKIVSNFSTCKKMPSFWGGSKIGQELRICII